jgi:hypothetical protein
MAGVFVGNRQVTWYLCRRVEEGSGTIGPMAEGLLYFLLTMEKVDFMAHDGSDRDEHEGDINRGKQYTKPSSMLNPSCPPLSLQPCAVADAGLLSGGSRMFSLVSLTKTPSGIVSGSKCLASPWLRKHSAYKTRSKQP